MTHEEEKIIIKRVIEGDKNAFEVLVLANRANVYNLALKMMKNTEDALDISQEAFIKAYRGLSTFRGDSRFSVWLYRLTYNLCIDAIRKSPDAKILSLDNTSDTDDFIPLEIPDIRELPEDSLLRSETRRVIAESIYELAFKHREILVMREVAGLNYEDIASVLSISTGTVKSRLSRARLKLMEILEKKGTYPDSHRLKLWKQV